MRHLKTQRLVWLLLFIFAFKGEVKAAKAITTITLNEKNAQLKKVFLEINRQTGYEFIASNSVLAAAKPVSIQVREQTLEAVLIKIFEDQPLQYQIQEKIIIISKRLAETKTERPAATNKAQPIRGTVTDTTGTTLPGATVKLKGTNIVAITDKNGEFQIDAETGEELEVSFISYDTKIVKINDVQQLLKIILQSSSSKLNEIQVIGYGTTTKKLNTGSVSTISAEEIEKQPVTNVLSALSGRMPGVFVQTTNGLPGGNINIQIRGKGSVLAGTDPLYIVDGIPFASALVPNNVVTSGSIIGANSPLNSLDPADIESISVLKDADATAIYGSRGTNGVVLITTKKGRQGKISTDAQFSKGVTRIANYPRLLNLDQYLDIRREAFANNGLTPSNLATSPNYAPDLTLWNGQDAIDWAKYLFGGTARSTSTQLSISGGSANTNFKLNGNYREESNVLPGDNTYQRGGMHFNLQHRSSDNKFSLFLSSSYITDHNRSANPVVGLSADILLPPNYPVLDPSGNYNWYVDNPYASTQASSLTKTNNLINNIGLSYTLFKEVNLKVSGGFNNIKNDQTELFPTVSLNPNGFTNPYFGSTNFTSFGTTSNRSVILEPQVEFKKDLATSTLTVLIGGTYQHTQFQNQSLVASNFTNQSLMQNLGSAAILSNQSSTNTEYKYQSVFGRATYNLKQLYILNATIRRDGSSRFGPGNQFGTFGSLGAAWLFSSEPWLKHNLRFISFGKLRTSYGITGNDQISDYQYLSTYSSLSTYNYQGISALRPSRIANGDFHWETARKMEMALELGLFNDRIITSIGRYQNRSHDQLVNYTLSRQTGFTSYQANLPAVVENSGWELELNTVNLKKSEFNWTTTINLTIPRNKLKSFEGFATSSYSQTLQLDYDITRIFGYQFLGVNPSTGVSSYAPQPGATATTPYQYFTIGKQTPDLYGGLGNTINYRGWQLDIFGQFARQIAKGGLVTTPGAANNSYSLILDRWQKPGDQTNVPKASTTSESAYGNSSANIFDASYFRIKNIALSYRFSQPTLQKFKVGQLKLFVQAQNLLTWWNRNSAFLDPESGALTNANKNIPPMKTITAGMQVSF